MNGVWIWSNIKLGHRMTHLHRMEKYRLYLRKTIFMRLKILFH